MFALTYPGSGAELRPGMRGCGLAHVVAYGEAGVARRAWRACWTIMRSWERGAGCRGESSGELKYFNGAAWRLPKDAVARFCDSVLGDAMSRGLF